MPVNFISADLPRSADILILGVMFHAKMNFEKHLRSVCRAAGQRHAIIRKSWEVFHDRSLPLRPFWCLSCRSEYCSAAQCSAADSHLKLLYRVVMSASILAGGVLEFNHAHRRSVAVLIVHAI